MITAEILTLMVSLCQVSSLEDTRGKWAKLQETAKFQHECLIEYISCYEKNSGNIIQCIKVRKIQGTKND